MVTFLQIIFALLCIFLGWNLVEIIKIKMKGSVIKKAIRKG